MELKLSRADMVLVGQIVERAGVEFPALLTGRSPLDLMMDLAAVHLNGCPLRLAELATAEAFDLVHDVAGIRRHLDRSTGRLMDCFVPRYAA